MNHRRCRIERGAHVRDGLELFIFDRDVFRGVLGDGAAGRHDGRDRFALPAHPVDRDRMLRRGFQALHMREHADPRRDDGRKLLAGDDGDHARHALCRIGIDATIFACACGERRNTTCAIRGSSMSLT